MSRGLTANMIAASSAKEVRPALACFMDFASGPLRIWTGLGSKVWGGNTFVGVGTIVGITAIDETKSVSANGLNISINGISSDIISLALSENYRGRKIFLWLWLLDSSSAIISDPTQIFAGRMNTMTLQDSGDTASVSLSAESRLVDLNRPRERRYTDGDQKQLYPGDRFFEYVASLQNKDFPWGRGNNEGATEAPSNKPPPNVSSNFH